MLRYTLLHVIVEGAKRLPNAPAEREEAFVETAALLVAAGANVNARYVAGHTALGKCLNGRDTTRACMSIALDVLGPAGADPNLADRFGHTPISNAAMTKHYGCLAALLFLGADPSLDAGSSISALSACHAAGDAPESRDARELFSLPVWKEGRCEGKQVVITGLEGAAGAALNGKVGTAQQLDPFRSKIAVTIEMSMQTLSREVAEEVHALSMSGMTSALDTTSVVVHPKRLELAEKLVGARVKLRGLAARPDLNGRAGSCVKFIKTRGRYEVFLAPDGAAAAESVNVRPPSGKALRDVSDVSGRSEVDVLLQVAIVC